MIGWWTMDVMNHSLTIALSALALVSLIVGGVAYLVRKIDKVSDIYGKMPDIKENTDSITAICKRLDTIEGKVETAFLKLDLRAVEIEQTKSQFQEGLDHMKITNSLVLEGLTILIETSPDIKDNEKLSKFKDKMSNETIIVAKRSSSGHLS